MKERELELALELNVEEDHLQSELKERQVSLR